MKFRLCIELDNAAFAEGNAHIEVARILRELANRLVNEESVLPPSSSYILRDVNGNTVGHAQVMK